MFKPSPQLCGRMRGLRFTTKQVGRGFYRGNRTGSMGAHTEWGGYVIDWRKTRFFVVPELDNFNLTPYVAAEMVPTQWGHEDVDNNILVDTPKVSGMEYLRQWKQSNPTEFDYYRDYVMKSYEVVKEKDEEIHAAPSSEQQPAASA